MIKAIIFDLDDTLYDEMQFVRGGFKRVSFYLSELSRIDQNTANQFLLDILRDRGRGQTFDILLKKFDLYNKALVQKLIEVYRTHNPYLLLYPGVGRVLIDLKNQGYRIGLITDGNVDVQKRKVSALGISNFFDCMIFSDEFGVEMQKPHPLPYEKALEALVAATEESVYVGDNPHKDFVTAKKMGMYTIRVRRGVYRDVTLAQDHEADCQIESLTDIFCLNLFKTAGKINE